MEQITQILGWMTLINGGLLIASTIGIWLFRDWAAQIHARIFGVDAADLGLEYFRYLAAFKRLWIVFNLTPWIVLSFLVA